MKGDHKMGESSVMTNFLQMATEVLTWLLTSMASIVSTIMANPILVIGFIVLIISFAFGLVFRSAGQR